MVRWNEKLPGTSKKLLVFLTPVLLLLISSCLYIASLDHTMAVTEGPLTETVTNPALSHEEAVPAAVTNPALSHEEAVPAAVTNPALSHEEAVPAAVTNPALSHEEAVPAAGAAVNVAKPAPTGRVFLTIDDGPDIVTTPVILDILDQYHIKATFFVIGRQAAKYPDLIKEMHRRGHYVGNHTYCHDYSIIYRSKEAFFSSLQKNEEILSNLTGTRPQYIRDPGGRLREFRGIRKHVEEAGYIVMGWNVDSYDSRSPVPDSLAIAENVLLQSEREHLWPNMVILLHEGNGRQNSVAALPPIIENLLARGFSFHLPGEE
jgi:peptidoglycan/xylan/chitin deacetylase (PgdA/CDA1 family)